MQEKLIACDVTPIFAITMLMRNSSYPIQSPTGELVVEFIWLEK